MKLLTPRQTNVFTFIVSYTDKYGYPPSLSEIANEFNFSTKTAFDYRKILCEKGYIEIISKTARGIKILVDKSKEND